MAEVALEERQEAAGIASPEGRAFEGQAFEGRAFQAPVQEEAWNEKQKLLAICAMALASWLVVGLALVGLVSLFG